MIAAMSLTATNSIIRMSFAAKSGHGMQNGCHPHHAGQGIITNEMAVFWQGSV
jgi:hypothetical protein